jgi:hypothetical protein
MVSARVIGDDVVSGTGGASGNPGNEGVQAPDHFRHHSTTLTSKCRGQADAPSGEKPMPGTILDGERDACSTSAKTHPGEVKGVDPLVPRILLGHGLYIHCSLRKVTSFDTLE